MAKCSLPYIEKRFRDSNPQLADKLNAIGLKVFEDISSSNLFARKSGNFMFNKQGTKKRVSQNEFVTKLNTDLGAEVVREIESKVSVNVLPLATEQEMAAVEELLKPTQTVEIEEFKSSEELPDSFLTLSDFEEPAYTPTTPETHPERVAPLAPEPNKFIPQQWEEYTNLKDRTDLTPDEELDLAVYRAKFDMFDSPSQYEKVMSDPTSKAFVSFREKNLEKLLLSFADKFGITIANIEDFQKQYFEKTGKFIPANGVANLFEKVIYVSEGNTDALTEEVAHFIIAMLPKDGELYQNLKQYISRTREYELFYDKYLAQYEGDVDKTEEEIMGKVFKNALQDKEETVPLSVRSVVKRIINYISDLFSDIPIKFRDYRKGKRCCFNGKI